MLVGARLLVLLTEVEGVFTRDPRDPAATLIPEGGAAARAAIGPSSALGTGGMGSKIVAAEMAASAGIPTVIAGGVGDDVLGPIVAGESRGTRFAPGEQMPSAYKLWLRFGKPSAGRLHVDEGAWRAVREDATSLLAVGVVRCEGAFEAGDAVELVGPDGTVFGKGIAHAPAGELARRRRGTEAVHRDRLVVY